MPIHDWTRVDAGIFHDFHHAWIEELKRTLNAGVLPPDYYALAEQHAAGFGPDVLTLQSDAPTTGEDEAAAEDAGTRGGVLLAPPPLAVTAETELDFYRRKQSRVTVRHVTGDRVVAMIEVVSPGNKASSRMLRSFVEKVAELLDNGVHLLILDLLPPGRRDPHGIHGAIWEEVAGQEYELRGNRRLTFAAYEAALTVRAFVVHAAIGEPVPEMPLFLQPGGQVPVPLEAAYQSAWNAVPRRWQRVLQEQ